MELIKGVKRVEGVNINIHKHDMIDMCSTDWPVK